jgi:alpha-L-fucosidase
VHALTPSGWSPVSNGTTIGHRKLDRFDLVTAQRLRVTIVSALATPRISTVALFRGG